MSGIYSREDVARYEAAVRLATKLADAELMRLSVAKVKGEITAETMQERVSVLGIVTASVAIQAGRVRNYVEEQTK